MSDEEKHEENMEKVQLHTFEGEWICKRHIGKLGG